MHRIRSLSLLTLSACVAVAGLAVLSAPAAAQPDNAQIQAQKQRAPLRTAPRMTQEEVRRANRRLISPLGSAANVRPGWYNRNLSQPQVEGHAQGGAHSYGHRHHGYGPGYGYGFGVPYVVYVDPTPREPQVVQEPPPRSYEPPPIYVIQPSPSAPIRPVEPVEPNQPVAPNVPSWRPSAPAPTPAPVERPRPARSTEPQPVTLSIVPAGADVYLDGEFLGGSADLAELDLRPGVYVLEVEHPDFADQRLVFGVDEAPLSVAIDLSAEKPSRRSRVK